MGLHGMPNFAATSRIIDDIELDSDRKEMCFNMAISSSSEDEDAQDGEEADSQTSEAHEDQMDNQMEVLEDIRVLFS